MKYLLLACLATAVAAIGWGANTQMRLPKKQTPPEGDFADIDGTMVHYVMRGTGPTLILIHGAGGSSREWTFSTMDKLTDRYRVIAVDRPGHGYTSRIKGRAHGAETMKEQADLIHKLAENLDVDEAIITGQSYGGGVALAFALYHPDMVKGLVMVSGVSHPWDDGLGDWYDNAKTWWGKYLLIPTISLLTTKDKAQETVDSIFDPDPSPQGYLDHMGLRLSARVSQIRANTEQINRSLEDVQAMVERYSDIKAPLEIIHGDKDITVPHQLHAVPLSKAVDGANLTVLEGTGHMPQQVHEAKVIAAIDRTAKRSGLR